MILKILFRSIKNVLQNNILSLVNDTTLAADISLGLKKNVLK